jgi:hypothetical protein
MKATQISIVMYGRDAHLLETRKWVLQSRGYRILTIQHLADLNQIPLTPPVALLVLCHTLSSKECTDAVARASSRWPEIKKLALDRDRSSSPSKVLGQVMHTLDGPTHLLTTVSELVGHAGSSSYSHTY